MTGRRDVMKALALGAAALSLPARARGGDAGRGRAVVKPPRLTQGATIGLVNPAGATFESVDVDIVRETLAALGLQSAVGEHVLDRYGYLAGTDRDRAEDVNEMFRDSSIDAILAVRGGWGCNRILPLLDYESIAEHPKALIGYSDITSLLVAVHARTGLVTFHGPDGISTWNAFTVEWFRRILFDGEAVTLENPRSKGDNLAQTRGRVVTITPGVARGRLVGGNLSVLSAMMGSDYLPAWEGSILFLEDIEEAVYRVDRMLTQLRLAGVLERIRGFVFGQCTRCEPGEGFGSLTLEEVFRDHIAPLNVPAWSGAMIGHIADKFTVPLGVEAEIDARAGTIRLLEPAVT